MEKVMRPVWAEIDLDALKYNVKNIRKLVGNKEIIAVVKADAYGHGAIDIVPTLLENGVNKLAVACISEGIELRESNIDAPIIILGYTPLECGEDLVRYNIEQTVYDLGYAKELSEIAIKNNKKAKVHIALDTGMGRIGFMPNDDSINDIVEMYKLEGIELEGIFTHFSSADESDKGYTYDQFKKLNKFIEELTDRNINIPFKHCSNSGAIIDLPETYLEGVRAGIILYGYYPSHEIKKENLDIKPVLTLKAKVAHVKEMDKDMYISYGRTFKTEKKSIIATIPIGYADGYSRNLSGKAKVIVKGKIVDVVGRICMDQCMIDVSDVNNINRGDEALIFGDGAVTVDDIARWLGTINYEITCMLGHRVPRIYKRGGKTVKVLEYLL